MVGQRQVPRAAVHRMALGEALQPGDRGATGFHAADGFPYRRVVVDLGFEPDPGTLVRAGPPPVLAASGPGWRTSRASSPRGRPLALGGPRDLAGAPALPTPVGPIVGPKVNARG